MGTHPIFESDFDCLTEMSLIVGVTICLLFIASFIFTRQKRQKNFEERKENVSESKLVLYDCGFLSEAVETLESFSFSTPRKMLTMQEYEEQGIRETDKAMKELRKIIENSLNPLKTFMKFGGETRAKMLDFVNSGEHLPVEENENLLESQIFEAVSDIESENVDLISTPKRKFDQLKKGVIYESPKRYPTFIHPCYAIKRR